MNEPENNEEKTPEMGPEPTEGLMEKLLGHLIKVTKGGGTGTMRSLLDVTARAQYKENITQGPGGSAIFNVLPEGVRRMTHPEDLAEIVSSKATTELEKKLALETLELRSGMILNQIVMGSVISGLVEKGTHLLLPIIGIMALFQEDEALKFIEQHQAETLLKALIDSSLELTANMDTCIHDDEARAEYGYLGFLGDLMAALAGSRDIGLSQQRRIETLPVAMGPFIDAIDEAKLKPFSKEQAGYHHEIVANMLMAMSRCKQALVMVEEIKQRKIEETVAGLMVDIDPPGDE